MASRRSCCQVERMTNGGASRIDRHILLGWAHEAETRLADHGRVARALSAGPSHSRIHSGRIVQRSALVDRLTTVGAGRVRSTWPMVAEMYPGEVRRISSTVRPTSRSPRKRNKALSWRAVVAAACARAWEPAAAGTSARRECATRAAKALRTLALACDAPEHAQPPPRSASGRVAHLLKLTTRDGGPI